MEKWLLRWRRWLLVGFIWLFWGLALTSMAGDSITMDEQNHIGRGVAFIHSGDPRLSLEHPPLVNSLSALPMLLIPELDIPYDHPSWQLQPPDVYWYVFADELVWQRGLDVQVATFLARFPIVVMTLGLALVAYRFGREVWQRPSTFWIIPLILFDPNILAHGRYSTTDLGGTLFMTLATFLLWRLWQCEQFSWTRWLWAAVGMGLAFASKHTALVFVLIWGVMAIWPLSDRRGVQRLLWFLSAGLASLVVIWALYGFEWGHLTVSLPLPQLFYDLKLPMPTYWSGVGQILTISTEGRMAYLNGRFQQGGFNSYFPIAFAIKTPLITLLLFVVSAVLLIWKKNGRLHGTFLLIPILAYFVITMQSGLNIGYRHLLPILPYIYLMIVGNWSIGNRRSGSILPVVALSLIALSLWIHPHYLSYFNQTMGGPQNGGQWLLDSNIDWGQDLIRLEKWMAANEVESVNLGWFGTAVPSIYQVPNKPLPGFPQQPYLTQWLDPPFNPAAPEPGIYAISVSSLYELPLPNSGVYAWFRQREPDARVGYSILIYDVE